MTDTTKDISGLSPLKVNQRDLGTQGLHVSAMGLGCMGMSDFYGNRDDAESARTLERAVELGVTLFDTSDIYGPHTNEMLVGKVLRPYRSEVKIATKFGILRDPARPQYRGVSGKPEYVQAACEASLRRLGVEAIDLYYQHRVDPDTPIEETVGAMARLVEQGKVRYLGLSEAAPETIRRAHATYPITALQTEYSLWSREPEVEILPLLRELGIGFVAYSPLGRGFLTGAITNLNQLEPGDFRRESYPRVSGENLHANLQLLEAVKRLAGLRGVTPGQMALAWVMTQGTDIVPIPGTKRQRYLEENVAAAHFELSTEELRELDLLLPVGTAAGERYLPAGMQGVNR